MGDLGVLENHTADVRPGIRPVPAQTRGVLFARKSMGWLGVLASAATKFRFRSPHAGHRTNAVGVSRLAGVHNRPNLFPIERRLNQFGFVAVDDLELLEQTRRPQQPQQDAVER